MKSHERLIRFLDFLLVYITFISLRKNQIGFETVSIGCIFFKFLVIEEL